MNCSDDGGAREPRLEMALTPNVEQTVTPTIARLHELTDMLDSEWKDISARLELAEASCVKAEASVTRLRHVIETASNALLAGDYDSLRSILREAGNGGA